MNPRHHVFIHSQRFVRRVVGRSLQAMLLLAIVLSPLAPVLAPVASAAPTAAPAAQTARSAVTLSVISARTEPRALAGAGVVKGAPITTYEYIINEDNTGTTEQKPDPGTGALPSACTPADPGYPGSCNWVSIAGTASSSPIVTQGDQSDFAAGLSLPPGRYLISVLADGFKLDGEHFTVTGDGSPVAVTVEMQPTPLPDATIRAKVFEDISITNSAPDVPAEPGLAGFVGHIADYIGEVTTDVYGNPLCTLYVGEDPVTHIIDPDALQPPDYAPEPIPGTGGKCVSDENGDLVIPHVGPNRYALSAVPPDGQEWIQTTTLEGNHDWDAWIMEGATGYDTEFVVAGEPFPATFFGFVKPSAAPLPPSAGAGTIKGLIAAVKVFVPTTGGQPMAGTIFGGLTGGKVDKPIENPWISLTDLQNGDTSIYIAQGNADGTFQIDNVPPGNYTLTWWDEPQDYILDLVNVTVGPNETVDMGVLPLTGWWTQIEGHVFNDYNRNGRMDPGEPGLSNFPVVMRKRENSLMDRGAVAVTTDAEGYYFMENAYPMTQWLVEEAYNDLYYTTGITYQTDNQNEPTTILGAGVDVSVLPIIGLSGRLDWGVHAYDATGTNGVDPQNGGIVGSISYDTTRNELDPRFAAVENWQPGVPDLRVYLYTPKLCVAGGTAPCDASGRYELASDGSIAKDKLINSYLTETWERPQGCIARGVDGDPLVHGIDENVLPTDDSKDCLEGPLMGVQFGPYATDQGTSAANFGAAVDGNYGFGDGCFNGTLDVADPSAPVCTGGDFTALTAGDYIVEVEIPTEADAWGAAAVHPERPLYQFTREEDINIFDGDQFVPQIPPPECAGPLHTVDVEGVGTDGYDSVTLPNGITVPASTPVHNPAFADGGGSVYEGGQYPLCNAKLVRVSNGRSVAPSFNVFTEVPVPGRFWGLIVDDLNFSSDPRSLLYGEKAGVAFAPVGIYDFANRLVTTVESDFNGLFDVLLPSTNRISCPTPSGVCANLYRFVGNDPGTPGKLNLNFKPQFRTISAEFEAFPGLIVPADLAPTQVGVSIQLPGSQFSQPVACALDATTPQLFRVSDPVVDLRTTTSGASFTITGQGFGATQGTGQVLLGTTPLPVTNWSDTSLTVSVPQGTAGGAQQLTIERDNGTGTLVNGKSTVSSVNGLTMHVLKSGTPFPAATVLDNFNRANSSSLGPNWTGSTTGYSVNGNTMLIQSTSNTAPVRWTTSFGANQEAYFTFTDVSNTASEQDLVLKYNSSGGLSMIEAVYDRSSSQIRIETLDSGNWRVRATFNGVTFGANDVFGARTLADGTVTAYKNGAVIGSTNITSGQNPFPTSRAQAGGQIGIWFIGTGGTNNSNAHIDNFGGGTVTVEAGYTPTVYRVGPGQTYDPGIFDPNGTPSHAIQNALEAAAANVGDALVVVYPGTPTPDNPRANPRGAYYENIVIHSAVKLQGVGPGGIYPNGTAVIGSVIDGSAFGGDTTVADGWRTLVAGLTRVDPNTGELVPAWDGNQNTYEGQTVYVLAADGQFTAKYPAAIDGFDLRGGDQMGFPNNINQIGGTPTGQPAAVQTQGGAIFVNAYARHLQITNNVVENNGGAYGTIRIGTPDLPQPDTSQHNENLRIANNRIINNGGTNLAGGIGLFAGSDNYEVAYNDICGNFSSEYGGGLTVYGQSNSGRIHHNRIYFNESFDEGGGIMIAGELPADNTMLSPGSGPVDIYANLIQGNLSNDDGGGIRFLMAGNYPMNVYNNMIVNNVSTHEGGGISLNDAPNVRVFNNTIMKNTTTATALTSNGSPAPAGLSTSANSDPMQASLPATAPTFSNPLVFNNIFSDNRAGTRSLGTVIGIGAAGDPTAINYWDMGVADGTGTLTPSYTIMQSTQGVGGGSNNQVLSDPLVIAQYNTGVDFAAWRTNPNFIGAIMVVVDTLPSLLGNYHIQAGSPAVDTGTASAQATAAPGVDFDNQVRPFSPIAPARFDIGADEYGTNVAQPAQFYYTINAGLAALGATLMDNPIFLPFVSASVTQDAETGYVQVSLDKFKVFLPAINSK